jgi:hypothetical protein
MLDFRKRKRAATGLPIPRFLLVIIGLAVFLFIVTWRSQPVGEAPIALKPSPDRTARRDDDPQSRGTDEAASAANSGDSRAYFPGVHAQYLDDVRDDTVFRAAESDAWFHLLELLEKNSAERLAAASSGPVGYLQLDRQPAAYRGRLVTVSGTARSAKEMTAPENVYGIESYYQIWLQPLRSDSELIVLYTLHLPLDFPVGDEIDQPITATGFFFKRWAYPSRSGILTAPLVLTRSIDWQPAPPTVVPTSSERQVLWAATAALLFAMTFLTWGWLRSRRPRATHLVDELVKLDDQALADAADQHASEGKARA